MNLRHRLRSDLYLGTDTNNENVTVFIQKEKEKYEEVYAHEIESMLLALDLAQDPTLSLVNTKIYFSFLENQDSFSTWKIPQRPKKDPLSSPVLLETTKAYLDSLSPKERENLLFIPTSSARQENLKEQMDTWVNIIPVYDPEKERQRIQKMSPHKKDSAKSNCLEENHAHAQKIPSPPQLAVTWKTRAKQIFWWVLIAGFFIVLLKKQ